ncbi:glycoside hydrolase family 38 N-terminal domain-containing protein [Stratiformator vulcanicus]|uniref:Glycoside hydrolase family 38 N-terminal domain-containing protein n=1 Tax=Stratiformator vulcanicus TaxID=2527980 RepID=A0A517R0C4_9PLAN|nr:hypothetical protein [Stratiformator vulcanicus]QDT37270.1 hypothetical protein Pan189_16430 [Stratiformator vulcanicus]
MSANSPLILLPSHGLDDFPLELEEASAVNLLDAFAAVFDPIVLAAAKGLWDAEPAEFPTRHIGERVIVIPEAAKSWLQSDWMSRAKTDARSVIDSWEDRDDLIAKLRDAFAEDAQPPQSDSTDPGESHEFSDESVSGSLSFDLAADFHALGTIYLQIQLLTRRMHYYDDPEDTRIADAAIEAAAAAVAGDEEVARKSLGSVFELLLEARERLYPVEGFLLDLCLLVPKLANVEWLSKTISGGPVSILADGNDWPEMAEASPEFIDRLREGLQQGGVSIVGGEWRSDGGIVDSVDSSIARLRTGRAAVAETLGASPTCWAQRHFGLGPLTPLVLNRTGYKSALHLLLDNGTMPDEEYSQFQWTGSDDSTIPALSRMPIAANSTAGFLRLADRLAESMDADQSAGIVFVRWPGEASRVFHDLQRAARYAPVLGKFVTFDKYFEAIEAPYRTGQYDAWEYVSPQLVRDVAAGRPDPISRPARQRAQYERLKTQAALRVFSQLLGLREQGQSIDAELDAALIDGSQDRAEGDEPTLDSDLSETEADDVRLPRRLAELISSGGEEARGILVLNPLAQPRRTWVGVGDDQPLPSPGESILHVQPVGPHRGFVADLPAAGFLWSAVSDSAASTGASGSNRKRRRQPPLAEEGLLRNDFFEVGISSATGGIGYVRDHNTRPKRLSQQLAFRFLRERLIESPESDFAERTAYSRSRCLSQKVLCDGPAVGVIETAGEIVDQQDDRVLAGFRQRFRVTRGIPEIEIEIELDIRHEPVGDPWFSYYACRFAWGDSSAPILRSHAQQCHQHRGQRIEAADFVEVIEDRKKRIAIFPLGRCFHRESDNRMLDSILVVPGESTRRFRFVVRFDDGHPSRASAATMQPPVLIPVDRIPATPASSAWLGRVDPANVVLTRLQPASSEDAGVAIKARLVETEGIGGNCRISLCRMPGSARKIDFLGETIAELEITDDRVEVPLTPYEVADVEISLKSSQ